MNTNVQENAPTLNNEKVLVIEQQSATNCHIFNAPIANAIFVSPGATVNCYPLNGQPIHIVNENEAPVSASPSHATPSLSLLSPDTPLTEERVGQGLRAVEQSGVLANKTDWSCILKLLCEHHYLRPTDYTQLARLICHYSGNTTYEEHTLSECIRQGVAPILLGRTFAEGWTDKQQNNRSRTLLTRYIQLARIFTGNESSMA